MLESMRVAVVKAVRAAEVLRHLHSQGAVDRHRRITKRGREVLIPLRPDADLSGADLDVRAEAADDLAVRTIPQSPLDRMRDRARAEGIPTDFVPVRWERVGDVVIVRLRPEARPRAARLGAILGETLRSRTVVEDVSGIHGPHRTPEVRVLWGDGTETVHSEGGIRYGLDVARLMFSAGNVAERTGIAARIRPGQVVVDLFAGIGYFALPIAVRSHPACVYACEVNPVAFEYLVANVRRNRASAVVPLLGDCRTTAPARVADWVLMGHFSASEYLDVAFRALRDAGTIVYHHLAPTERFPRDADDRIRAAAESAGFALLRSEARRVKSYAPGILHGVIEATVGRKPKGT